MSNFTIEATFVKKYSIGQITKTTKYSGTAKDALAYMNSFSKDDRLVEITVTDDSTNEIVGKIKGT